MFTHCQYQKQFMKKLTKGICENQQINEGWGTTRVKECSKFEQTRFGENKVAKTNRSTQVGAWKNWFFPSIPVSCEN